MILPLNPEVFDVRGADTYSFPAIAQIIGTTGQSLVEHIYATPLLTVEEVLYGDQRAEGV